MAQVFDEDSANEAWLAAAYENFGAALAEKNYQLAEDIAQDMSDNGFVEQGANLLLALQNAEGLVTFEPVEEVEAPALEIGWQEAEVKVVLPDENASYGSREREASQIAESEERHQDSQY